MRVNKCVYANSQKKLPTFAYLPIVCRSEMFSQSLFTPFLVSFSLSIYILFSFFFGFFLLFLHLCLFAALQIFSQKRSRAFSLFLARLWSTERRNRKRFHAFAKIAVYTVLGVKFSSRSRGKTKRTIVIVPKTDPVSLFYFFLFFFFN